MTLNREKSEKLFNRIHKVGNMITRLSGVVQNSDSVNESNAYENYLIFREEYSRCISELSKINEAVATLHEEIDNRHSYRFDQEVHVDTIHHPAKMHQECSIGDKSENWDLTR